MININNPYIDYISQGRLLLQQAICLHTFDFICGKGDKQTILVFVSPKEFLKKMLNTAYYCSYWSLLWAFF